jgi:hypothetical protein
MSTATLEQQSPLCEDLLHSIEKKKREGSLDVRQTVQIIRCLEMDQELVAHEVRTLLEAMR